jgi:serine/threonine protein kinase
MSDGEDLAVLVEEHGPLSLEKALDCIRQAAHSLEELHSAGMAHRAISPPNLILRGNGTITILAPEFSRSVTEQADPRADIYNLGCCLYFLLTGQPMHGGKTLLEQLAAHRELPAPSLREACPLAPDWLEAVFQKMVAKKPSDRYQSAGEVICALEQRM